MVPNKGMPNIRAVKKHVHAAFTAKRWQSSASPVGSAAPLIDAQTRRITQIYTSLQAFVCRHSYGAGLHRYLEWVSTRTNKNTNSFHTCSWPTSLLPTSRPAQRPCASRPTSLPKWPQPRSLIPATPCTAACTAPRRERRGGKQQHFNKGAEKGTRGESGEEQRRWLLCRQC